MEKLENWKKVEDNEEEEKEEEEGENSPNEPYNMKWQREK